MGAMAKILSQAKKKAGEQITSLKLRKKR